MNAKYGMPATPMSSASAMNERSPPSARTPRSMSRSESATPGAGASPRRCVSDMSSDSKNPMTPHTARNSKMPRQPARLSTNVPRNGASAGPMMMSDCRHVMASFRSGPA